MNAQPTKKPKHRSPASPAIDLETALMRTKQLWDAASHYALPLADAMNTWGYSAKSSGGLQTAASLKYFGLAVDERGPGGRHIKVSDLGRTIVIDDDTPERRERVTQAALNPAVNREVWDNWQGLPPAGALRSYLVNERRFGQDAANDFIKQVTKTFEYAGLTDASVSYSSEVEDAEPDAEHSVVTSRTSVGAVETHGPGGTQYTGDRRIVRPHGVAMMEIPVPVRAGVMANLTVPVQMSDAEWENLVTLLHAYRSVMAHAVRLEDEGLSSFSDDEVSAEKTEGGA